MGISMMVFRNFANTGTGNPTNFYAGILTTTNLGGALVEVADAVWQGHLYAARVDGAGGYEQAQFVLAIDFPTKTISATGIPVRRVSGAALADDVATYGFTAMFDTRGVFNAGTITRTLSTVASAGTFNRDYRGSRARSACLSATRARPWVMLAGLLSAQMPVGLCNTTIGWMSPRPIPHEPPHSPTNF